MTGLLSASEAVKELNCREGFIKRPCDIGEGFELFHKPTSRTYIEWIVPGQRRFLACPPRRWYILVDVNGNRRNYLDNYSRAVRHFEYLTRIPIDTISKMK